MDNASLPSNTKITFIGAGNMASSIAGGLIKKGHPADAITLCDPAEASRKRVSSLFPGVNVSADNEQAIVDADVVVLAVKPQVMEAVCQHLSRTSNSATVNKAKEGKNEALPKLFLSIAAGITVQQMETWLGGGAENGKAQAVNAIIRCMPNTPALINEGITGFFANQQVSENQKQIAAAILAAVGDVIEVSKESDINTITAVSGSGPAYYFYMMEAMVNAGEALGLSRETATQLTLKTALGAARLASLPESPEPSTLREQVTSPGGTTQRALETFNAGNVDKTVIEAIKAAHDRAIELAN